MLVTILASEVVMTHPHAMPVLIVTTTRVPDADVVEAGDTARLDGVAVVARAITSNHITWHTCEETFRADRAPRIGALRQEGRRVRVTF